MSRSFLMVLPKEMRVGRRAGVHRHLDLGHRGGVEGRAHRGQQAQDFRRRVGLHRVVDLRIGQGLLEGMEIVAHDVEVDDQAGAFRTSGGEEVEDALGGHRSLQARGFSARKRAAARGPVGLAYTRWTKASRRFMEPAGGDPGTMKRRLAAMRSLTLPGSKLALSALAWKWETRSALPAMKVCLFSNSDLWTTGRAPERPAPSLLQGVLDLAVGR